MKKHILLVTQYFYPEQFRINDLCMEWVKRGYRVTVLTGLPNYPQGKIYPGYGPFNKKYSVNQDKKNFYGARIIRLPLVPRGKNPIMLALNYCSFILSGFFWMAFTRLKADLVFIYEVSPMTQALPGVWYAKKNKLPCYLYVTDLWPENVEVAAGITNHYLLRIIGAMVDYIYARCDRIFTSSYSFIEVIEARGVNKEKLEFWPQYAEDYYQPISKDETKVSEIPQDGILNIIFAGNIGYAQGLELLPRVAGLLKRNNIRVRFPMVGDGRFKDSLKKLIVRQQVTEYFQFIPQQPPERIPELMADCDAAIICLAKSKVYSLTLPAKTQSYLACGIPILVAADGEVQEVIKSAGAGLCSAAGDVIGLAENIKALLLMSEQERKAMTHRGYDYYKEHYSKEVLLDKMDRWLSDQK